MRNIILISILLFVVSCNQGNKRMEDPAESEVAPMTLEQRARVRQFSEAEILAIDDILYSETSSRWQKVAMVVAGAMISLDGKIENIPNAYYLERIQLFIDSGKLESQGNIWRMRFSEIKRKI